MKFRIILVLFLVVSFNVFSHAQQVMLQGWYWDYPKTVDGASWVDTLDNRVQDLATAGFTHIWLPPLSRASFGNGSNGYDPKDLYDLGEFGGGATGFGSRAQLDALITKMNAQGIKSVADVVYNHRDGGSPEINPAVEGWIENYNGNSGEAPFPSDRYRCILPLGGTTGNGAGTYYFKLSSASGNAGFYNRPYRVYMETKTTGFAGLPAESEVEPNGGGDCAEGNNIITLGVDIEATLDNGGCTTDEYALAIQASDFDAAGDTLYIYLTNPNGDYSDHRFYGIWDGSKDIIDELRYETFTDFTGLPSGRGGMNYQNFKPNGNPTTLSGDHDGMWFFYDYDQNVQTTKDTLIEWSKWLWEDAGIRGYRMDAIKHFDPSFVGELLNELHAEGKNPDMVVGEFFDSNPFLLKGWIDNVTGSMTASANASIKPKIFDFGLRDALEKSSDSFGFDVRNVFQSGIVDGASGSGFNVVTFVNNHDFRDEFQPVDNDPILGYAYVLLNNQVGVPSIFYPDYYGTSIPHGTTPPLKTDIDNLISIQRDYILGSPSISYLSAFGSTAVTYTTGFPETSLIFSSQDGGSGSDNNTLSAINYAGEALDAWVDVSGIFNPGDVLYDITGKSALFSTVVQMDGKVNIKIDARSYGVYSDKLIAGPCGTDTIVYVDLGASGLNNGATWTDAFTSLNSALHYADRCQNITEVWVREGNYIPNTIADRSMGFRLNRPIKLIGGFPSSVQEADLNDRNPVLFNTTLSGGIGTDAVDDNIYHVLRTEVLNPGLIVDGFTISEGSTDVMGPDLGGGIYNKGWLRLQHCIIRENGASGMKSQVYNSGVGARLILQDCTIVKNGAMDEMKNENNGEITILGSVTIEE